MVFVGYTTVACDDVLVTHHHVRDVVRSQLASVWQIIVLCAQIG